MCKRICFSLICNFLLLLKVKRYTIKCWDTLVTDLLIWSVISNLLTLAMFLNVKYIVWNPRWVDKIWVWTKFCKKVLFCSKKSGRFHEFIFASVTHIVGLSLGIAVLWTYLGADARKECVFQNLIIPILLEWQGGVWI